MPVTDHFFGIPVQPDTLGGMSLPLVLAVILGGAIGLERELHAHPAGLRTHILVCLGSTLITIISFHASQGDPGRIAAQIVTGIGFLGAGAIIREGATIKGLTTAASIWTTAGIGIALGAGPFYGELAVIATGIVLFTLWLLNYVEDWVEVRIHRQQTLEVHVQDIEKAAGFVLARVAAHNVMVFSIEYQTGKDPNVKQMLFRVKIPERFNSQAFLADLADEPGVVSVNIH